VDAIALRSIERMLAILSGALAIYLGFRLFLAIPERKESEGKVLLPGGISIYLTRIGPGAFFALFGAIIVSISLRQAITYQESPKLPVETSSSVSRSYTGWGSSHSVDQSPDVSLFQVSSDIQSLNTLPTRLRHDLSAEERTDVALMVPRLKLALLESAWNADWGNFSDFREWVLHGAAEPAPKALAIPANLYLRGDMPK
jgi:hypothetical protein